MAPVFALIGATLVIALGGTIDIARVMSARDQLQDIADSAALAGVTRMGTGGAPVTTARQFVNAAVAALPGAPTVTGSYDYDYKTQTVTVALEETVSTTFGALMIPSVRTNVTSTATGTMGQDCTHGDVTFQWDRNDEDPVITVNCTKLGVQQASIHLVR